MGFKMTNQMLALVAAMVLIVVTLIYGFANLQIVSPQPAVIEEFPLRAKRLQDVCAETRTHFNTTNGLRVYEPANIAICVVHKAASTVTLRFLLSLSPSYIPSMKILDKTKFQLHHEKRINSNVTHKTPTRETRYNTILTARNPYTRLWSAYVDKIHFPAFIDICKDIVKNYRESSSNAANYCGYDVTFAEFIRFVIGESHMNKMNLSAHWWPISETCSTCNYNYQFILKYETLQTDFHAMIQELDLPTSVQYIFPNNAAESVLKDELEVHLGHFRHINQCMTEIDYLGKIWKGLVYNGYIQHNEVLLMIFLNVPFKLSAVLAEIKQVRRQQGIDKDMQTELRRRALAEAYQQIPETDIIALKRIYKLDFQMFKYDSDPPS